MRVQSSGFFDRVGSFDPGSGELVEMAREDAVDLLQHPLGGHYAQLGDQVGVFYRTGGSLRFCLGDRDIEIDAASGVKWSSDSVVSTLQVVSSDGTTICVSYPSTHSLEGDFTPMVEPEDFDFGLFVANVVADEERFASIYPGSRA